ncbi:MAG: hypothetical protein OI715_00210 (plasmid) [Candidatus Methanoperedens sp.]|nr:MAG: hypothetical protein OI715_00210 [Candidatus Methanoperedens sp.]
MDYLKWIDEKAKTGMSWLLNSIETNRKINPRIPEMTIARDIAARSSIGCGLVRRGGNTNANDVILTISEANKRFRDAAGQNHNQRGSRNHNNAIRNIEIHGIITDLSGFMIISRCGKCGREMNTTKNICSRCGGEATTRLMVFGEISDYTGALPFIGEDRVAEIILAAHPSQIAGSLHNIQRGFLFTFKHHFKAANHNHNPKDAIISANPISLLRSVVNPDYARALIGLPIHAAGNIEQMNGLKVMKLFWFETVTYQEEITVISKQQEVLREAKNPLIMRRLECLKKM